MQIIATQSGFNEVDLSVGELGEFDLLVDLKAGAINPVDLKVKSTLVDSQKVLGYDGSGVVSKIGGSVTRLKVGDEVYFAGDISRSGTYSSKIVVDSRVTSLKPKTISFEDAAALPLTSITAYESLFDRMRIVENQTGSILIIGGAGGVGSMATQLLKAKTQLTVVATASRDESGDWCKKMGADYVINYKNPIVAELKKIGLDEVDYILCANDTTSYWSSMVESIAPQGTICSIVDNREPIMLNDLKRKSATFVWEFMFTRPLFKTKDILKQSQLLSEVAGLVDSGDIITTATNSIGKLSVESIEIGHGLISDGHTIGKVTFLV